MTRFAAGLALIMALLFATQPTAAIAGAASTPVAANAAMLRPDSVQTRSVKAVDPGIASPLRVTEVVRTAVLLTLLAMLPALVICMTPFIRIVVVLSMIRHAFGMPETPPNAVLVSLALLITALLMSAPLAAAKRDAMDPFLAGSIGVEDALARGSQPMRAFMLRQVKESDIAAVYRIARQSPPGSAGQVGVIQVTTAFMLNELRTAFKIGFVIFLPFLVIDVVISSLLISLGMIMVPPSTLSLPLKVLMFVLIDGWGLVLGNVAASFR